MKIHLASDLHVEFGPLELPGGDVLLLAGDVSEARYLKHLNNCHPNSHALQVSQFWLNEITKYDRVYYVLGNHEYYNNKYWKVHDYLRANLPTNVELLENDTVALDDDTLLVGACMWTDCNKYDDLTMFHLRAMMSDYSAITYKHEIGSYPGGEHYRKIRPEDTCAIHRRSLDYFRHVVKENRDKKIVCMTHHAPSFSSVNESYKHDTLMNGGYASDLSEFILDHDNIKYWFHGHMHDPVDYMIGDCRVLSNPRGYKGYETRATNFTPLELEL